PVLLLRPLINPGPNQPHLSLRERLPFVGRGHPVVLIADAGYVVNQHAFGAFAGLDYFAVLPALEGGGEAIDTEFALLLLRPMAFEAGFLKDGLDVLVVSQALGIRSRRQLADVHWFFICRHRAEQRKPEDGRNRD